MVLRQVGHITKPRCVVLVLVAAVAIFCLLMVANQESLSATWVAFGGVGKDSVARLATRPPTLSPDQSSSLRFQQRSELLQIQCERPDIQSMLSKTRAYRGTETLASDRLKNCPIPKVGTTFTTKLQKQISGLNQTHYSDFNDTRNYVQVREPYSRAMSGYLEKMVTNQLWWSDFGKFMISNFRSKATKREIQCGSDVTFPEFVKYLIYSQQKLKGLNKHFQPIFQQCDFCEHHYDYVVHLETIGEDMDYIIRSVNVTDIGSLSFDDSEMTVAGKCKNTVRVRDKVSKCKNFCDHMQTVWWFFQARGLISKDIPLNVTGDTCMTISGEDFAQLALKAHRDSASIINRSKQKRETLVELFSQVPLEDRLRLRELYLPDFELFGYDSKPPDIFPELNVLIPCTE